MFITNVVFATFIFPQIESWNDEAPCSCTKMCCELNVFGYRSHESLTFFYLLFYLEAIVVACNDCSQLSDSRLPFSSCDLVKFCLIIVMFALLPNSEKYSLRLYL